MRTMPALRLAALIVGLGWAAGAAAEIAQDKMQACPFSVADLKAGLGLSLREGKPGQVETYGSNKAWSCRYLTDRGLFSVTQFWSHAGDVAKTRESVKRVSSAFKSEAIAGDADGALVILDQHDANKIILRYMRENVMIEILASDLGKGADLKDRLVKLRRVP